MIDFRYHVVSIVAVFLALAVGVVLGTTTLNGPLLHDLKDRSSNLADTNASLQSQNDGLQSQLQQEDKLIAGVTPYAAAGRLRGQTVALVSGPGVGGDVRSNVIQALQAAGASVASDIRLTKTYVDPTQDALLDSLASRLAGPGVSLPRGATGAQRAAVQLASMLVTKAGPHQPGDAALQTTLSTYAAAKLLTVNGPAARTATTAVVLGDAASDASPSPTDVNAAGSLVALAAALDAGSEGAVLAAAGPGSNSPLLSAASKSSDFSGSASAVPQVDTAAGQLATVFALVGQLDDKAAIYRTPAAVVAALPTPSP